MLTGIPKSTNFSEVTSLKRLKQQHARHGARTPVGADKKAPAEIGGNTGKTLL